MFYGWVVLLGCVLLQLASAPGHTFGANAFVESWIAELGLSRTQISYNWLVASLSSAAAVPVAGTGLDRYGATRMTVLVAPLLVLTLLLMSRATTALELAISWRTALRSS